MSIATFFNHTVRIYRKPDLLASRGTLSSTSKTPAAIGAAPTVNNARPDQDWGGQTGGSMQDTGPGETQTSKRRWFLHKNLDVRERDILSVIAGPEAGLVLEVQSVAKQTNPTRVHHIEVAVDVWRGELP